MTRLAFPLGRIHLATYECSAYIADMSYDGPERTRHRQRQAELDDALAANALPSIKENPGERSPACTASRANGARRQVARGGDWTSVQVRQPYSMALRSASLWASHRWG